MKKKSNVGRAEMDVLRYVTDHQPVTVRDVADHFAEAKGCVRTTILNVMERLREKGYLVRKRSGGVYQYSLRVPKSELLRGLVRDFVSGTLGGSVSPFVAYLVEESEVTPEELGRLKELVRQIESEPTEKRQ